jgi:hypothetical protein
VAGPVILSGSTLAAGIRDDFDATYQPSFDGTLKMLAGVMQMDVPMNHRTETFAMHETMPYPDNYDEGNEAIPEEVTGSKSFTSTARSYGKRVAWRRIDRVDNKIGDLRAKAQMLGNHFASLDARAFIDLLLATTTTIPAVPNAPDGAALFSTTDGASAARFGVTGGNIVTGTGVATSAQVQTDFFGALDRFAQFQDIKGQPYYEADAGAASYIIYAASVDRETFTQALKAQVVHSVSVGTDTTDPGTGAGVSNVIIASGEQVTIVFTARLATGDWYIFRSDAPVKAVFSGVREPLRSAEATEDNSDEARNSGREYVQWSVRKSHGVNVPFAAIKVNN